VSAAARTPSLSIETSPLSRFGARYEALVTEDEADVAEASRAPRLLVRGIVKARGFHGNYINFW
jgi:hypothetical protein